MKQHTAFLATLFAFACFLASCKKEKDINTEELRLTSITATDGGSADQTIFSYNDAGKITKVSGANGASDPSTIWNISYSGKQIIMTAPGENSASAHIADTIWLTLDNNNRVQKRIQHSISEYKITNPSSSYILDTTNYEYDAAGLVAKGIRGHWDSTWFANPGTTQSSSIRKSGTDTYSNVNGNLTSINSSMNVISFSEENGIATTFNGNEVSASAFQYTKKFANKIDFKNAAVLNELNVYTAAPVNSGYANLPDHLSYTATTKDSNGAVITTDNSENNYNLGYTYYGFMYIYLESAHPNLRKTYLYE
jgi:hypothetical protein